jgi:hypothetical protein
MDQLLSSKFFRKNFFLVFHKDYSALEVKV